MLYQNNLVNPSESLLYHANSTTSGDNNSAYDPLGRQTAYSRGVLSASGHNGSSLDTVSYPSQTQSWSLDALGNWSSQTTSGVTTNRTFNAQNETTSVSSGSAPTYNNNGDTTSDNGDTYVYDAWDRLVAVKSGSTTIASYSNDALGRRITETYGSTTNNLYYSPQWQVIEERQNGTANTNVTFQYVWGASYIDQMVFRDTYSDGVETQRLYAQYDANYDTTSLVNMSGSVVERYLYDPYGNMTVLTANWTPVSGNVSQSGWRYNFQGGRFDVSTGWYDFRNRDYIPTQGTWAERDPLGFGGGSADLFSFVSNSPEDGSDPFGTAEERYWGQSLYEGTVWAWDHFTPSVGAEAAYVGTREWWRGWSLDDKIREKEIEKKKARSTDEITEAVLAKPCTMAGHGAAASPTTHAWAGEIHDAMQTGVGVTATMLAVGTMMIPGPEDFVLAGIFAKIAAKYGLREALRGGRRVLLRGEAELTEAEARAMIRELQQANNGRLDFLHTSYDSALQSARRNAGDLGSCTKKMYDPKTGTLIGEMSADGKRGWRIDSDHVNYWDWTIGKKGSGGSYGHDYYPSSQAGPHSEHTGYAPWEG